MTEQLHKSFYNAGNMTHSSQGIQTYEPLLIHEEQGYWNENDEWMDHLDVSAFDSAYIDRLLREAFKEWNQEVKSIPSLQHSIISLWNSSKLCLAKSGENSLPIKEAVFHTIEEEHTKIRLYPRLVSVKEFERYDLYMVPLQTRTDGKQLGLLCVAVPEAREGLEEVLQAGKLFFQSSFYRHFEHLFLSDLLHIHKLTEKENRRRSILFQIVQRMHDRMDVQSVLEEVFDSVAFLFPAARLTLYMSQDGITDDPRVKPLYLQGQYNPVCARAYTEERFISQPLGKGEFEFGIPFRGKQGTYGVFHIEAPQELIEDVDIQLIVMLADTAGNAYENAKMHEQSNTLIQELRMIDELTKRLNQSLQLADIYEYAVQQLMRIFKAKACCILQIDSEDQQFRVLNSSLPSLKHEKFPLCGISGEVYRTGEPFIIFDYEKYSGPSSVLMDDTGSMSMMAVPLRINGQVEGTILVSHQKKQFFSYDNFRFLDMLGVHIGLAVTNATLHAEVKRLATVDALTGLYVRHYMDRMIEERQNSDFCGSLIVIDLDHFKQVNDSYGHQIGDTVLKQVSDVIRSNADSDDLCARWGGEELAIYLPQISAQQAQQIAEAIRIQIPERTSPSITVSCGIGEWCWLDDQVSVESLFYRADMALYEAKNSGKNKVCIENKNSHR
ncbi:sensor domain-containing diguanylate cyclase [Paenibacillus sp. Marseille-Q4541]|uniref:sensor domain-containing diguanylate cyclase n=1 Tax=Paenibacillus sp. Marseille-Q4541 TaxID=2831522 RepID=UPI001BADC9A7|nr:sensor domain-containing diguanylate cyclase [Paenibacillus sp. Marseille-Q4541]